MALSYIFKKYKDVYTIENTGIVTLYYTLSKKECSSVTTAEKVSILVGSTGILPIKNIDGVYSIKISDSVSEEILPDILFYNNLLLSLINGTQRVLCGCKGCGCPDCADEDCLDRLVTLVSSQSYFFANNPKYTSTINLISKILQCSIDEGVNCLITNQQITGKQEIKDLLYKILSMYYLSFYLTDRSLSTDDVESAYIDIKYKFPSMIKCIEKTGISYDEVLKAFNDYVVYYYQIDNPISTIINEIPLLTPSYVTSKPKDNYSTFEQGKIINYTTVGRVAFVLSPAQSTNFILEDSLGNDITDQFDTYYETINKYALFVSKIPYIPSNVFFKFKQLNI
jgi:hypothetical protein